MITILFVLYSLFIVGYLGAGGDYCGSGYISPTGRNWTLSVLTNPTYSVSTYTYYLNLCDKEDLYCGGQSALCQADTSNGLAFYSLGENSTGVVTPISDTVLQVSFTNGTYCYTPEVNRSVDIFFTCTNNGDFVNITEDLPTRQCHYIAYVNVPSSQCTSTVTATTTTTPTTASTTTTPTLTSGTSTSSGNRTITSSSSSSSTGQVSSSASPGTTTTTSTGNTLAVTFGLFVVSLLSLLV